jgi:hypothetical protein
MMFKIRQGLNLQQSSKHPGIVRRFLHGHQVLNLTEGHHPLGSLLWNLHPSLKIANWFGVLAASSWVVWIHEKLQLDPFRLFFSRPINLVHLLHLGNKRNGGLLHTEGGKAAEDLENLVTTIVWIEILQQKCDHSALC